MAKLLLSTLFITLIGLSPLAHAQLKITVTTGMIADLVSHIAKDKAKVQALMGVGVDPHLYKATQGDVRKLSRADIIFYNGLHLEGKLQPILQKMQRRKTVIAVTENFPETRLITFDKLHDPHVWFDVSLWELAAKEVQKTLTEKDPENAAFYQRNAEQYRARLNELHQWVKQEMQKIPLAKRVLITAHDAFGYFGKAYDLEVMGLQGISTAGEFGLQDIKQLKDVIVARDISAVFVESSVSPKFIESLVKGVQAEGKQLRIGGELYSDAMGAKGSDADTYIKMVKHNVHTIRNGLLGKTTEQETH
ncbi:metal ABC transporter solute-binding protein, Zn/Mn family [Thiomicrorhabdus sp. 6S3-12]|uniref:metal ABC transporter solute-binding protein, Zn/Mn family n=1 Tax=Thiomicrorhabdus sp. 6S3-12 TaxID=2819681 RepID=UPI001AAD9938|nr:zinc ABC transporter substrate-binding protein [Thiomicrorhabdus sp. 6S3-12]MBO1923518.1 zinc ABC transporter substrate-binding protein [Thiomicrorhabdus sp. 6S3-12]